MIKNIKVHENMPAEKYHKAKRVSASLLKGLRMNGAAVTHDRMVNGWPPSSAMRLGSLVHTKVLEPELWGENVKVAPCKKDNAAAFAKTQKDFPSCFVVTEKEWEEAILISANVLLHEEAARILTGRREVSVFFDFMFEGIKVPMKCRFDVLGDGFASDLKTTRNASPTGFPKEIANLAYQIQVSLYSDVAKEVLGVQDIKFPIVAAETSGKFMVGIYYLDADGIETGRMHYLDAIEQYLFYEREGWPTNYTEKAMEIRLPGWA